MADAPQRPWRIAHSECSLGWGGQEHRVVAELAGFKRRGHPVWLIAPPTAQIVGRAEKAGILTVAVRPGKLRFLPEAWRLAGWLRRERIEVLNTHSSADGWLVGLAGRLAKVPLLIRSRHIDVDYPNRWLSRHAYTTLADHVLTTSKKITAHFQETFHLPTERITTLPTGIDIRLFSPDGAKVSFITQQTPTELPAIGMVSVLRSWKGHDTFLAAVQLLQQQGFRARYFIVGDGPQHPSLLEKIRAAGLAGVVHLAGHREDVPDVLRALDVLVIASTKHEGVPQIGLQALACRTAVVGSDVGGTPEIIRPGETGRIFPAGNAKALAGAIQVTLTNREETLALTERGRREVETRHSLDAMLDQLEVIYQRYLPR